MAPAEDVTTDPLLEFVTNLERALDRETRERFTPMHRTCLIRSMKQCGMTEYPRLSGDPHGERCSGQVICEECGQLYYAHPMDWRVVGYNDEPFLNVLCDGRRVKL